MLTSFEIENFKGIAARKRITIAPLPLLLGRSGADTRVNLHSIFYSGLLMFADKGTV